jgi:hypothetical protein
MLILRVASNPYSLAIPNTLAPSQQQKIIRSAVQAKDKNNRHQQDLN